VILANLQGRLTERDAALVVDALSRGEASRRSHLERRVVERGLGDLLDDPALFGLLCARSGIAAPSPALFLCVAVRDMLRRVGIEDALLSDYIGALLYEFGLRDRAYRISPVDDEVYRYVIDMIADLGAESGRRRFLLQVHLGNFTLWLSGVFPDHIASRHARRGGPGLEYYERMGAAAFREAADHRLAREYQLVHVYERAAESFAVLRAALNRLSDRLLFPAVATPERILRQVRDDTLYPPLGE